MAKRTNISDVYIGEDWFIPFLFKPVINITGYSLRFALYTAESESPVVFERLSSLGEIIIVSAPLATGYTYVPRSITRLVADGGLLTRRTYWWEMTRVDPGLYKLLGYGELYLNYDV